jgi:hypothetical protein
MAIEVRSPHSGHPVKVREEDVGRAIRDESGRIFYVLERTDGAGYYGSFTRAGSESDQQRYDDMVDRIERGEFVPTPVKADTSSQAAAGPHDATGRRRVSPIRLVAFLLLVLAILLALAGLADWWFDLGLLPFGVQGPAPTQPAEDRSQSMRLLPQLGRGLSLAVGAPCTYHRPGPRSASRYLIFRQGGIESQSG